MLTGNKSRSVNLIARFPIITKRQSQVDRMSMIAAEVSVENMHPRKRFFGN